MSNFQFTKQEVKSLKEKMMPRFIKEAIANGYTGWQAEDQAQDYFSFFLRSIEQDINKSKT